MKASEEGTACIISFYVVRPVGDKKDEDSPPSSHPVAASSIHAANQPKDEG